MMNCTLKIEVTAHRGNSTVTMPNTIPAFKEAIKEGQTTENWT